MDEIDSNKVKLTYVNDLIFTMNADIPKVVVSYIHQGNINTIHLDKIKVRDLKVDSLLNGLYNEELTKSLELRIELSDDKAEFMPSVYTVNIELKNKIRIDDVVEIDEYLRRLVLDEIYKISALNKHIHIEVIKDIDFVEKEATDISYCSEKIIGRIKACSHYIAIESRIGGANVVIIHPKFRHIFYTSDVLNYSKSTNKYNIGILEYMTIILDDKIGDTIIILRKAQSVADISNNVLLTHRLVGDILSYKITNINNCVPNYVSFDVNGLDL